jgi:hypothetical protein
MFGGEDDAGAGGGMFAEDPTPVNTANQRGPIISGGGLFGGEALKDMEQSAPAKAAGK